MAPRKWWAMVVAAVIGGGLAPRAARAADSGQGSTPLADDRTLVALAVALACADAPQAEPPAGGPDLTGPANEGPELELVATVRAKALKFDIVPKTQVVFQGTGRRKTTWKTERVNLPMHPEPGVTYRDVAVRLTVTSDIQELAALLREAKKASAGIQMEQTDPPAPPGPAAGASAKSAPGAASAPGTTSSPAAPPPATSTSAATPGPAASPIPAAPAAPAAPPAPTAPPAATVAPAAPPAHAP